MSSFGEFATTTGFGFRLKASAPGSSDMGAKTQSITCLQLAHVPMLPADALVQFLAPHISAASRLDSSIHCPTEPFELHKETF